MSSRTTTPSCKIPPCEWRCTREPGHDGPCAATPEQGKPLRYVLGFMFSASLTEVLLIQKNRPEWQAGKLNGVGGKVEPFEDEAVDAMCREFREETGLHTSSLTWRHMLTIDSNHPGNQTWSMEVFYSVGNIRRCKSTTDEEVVIVPVDDLAHRNLIDNNRWLIPLALHHIRHPHHDITSLRKAPEPIDAELVSESGTETLHRVVTCVYCGQHYEAGTPTHGAELLTKHIEECEQHPLRAERAKTARLRDAILDTLGCDTMAQVRELHDALYGRSTEGSQRDMTLKLCAAILSTLNPGA